MKPLKLILIKNYNFGNNLKIGLFWQNIAIWITDYDGKRIAVKKEWFAGIKRWHLHKKIRPIRRCLVDLQGSISVI